MPIGRKTPGGHPFELFGNMMMTSDHLRASQLAGYLDHDLAPDERRAVAAHLDACAECRAEVTALVRMGLPGSVPLPGRRPTWQATLPWLVPLAVAAGIGIFMVARPPRLERIPSTERPATGLAESMPRLQAIAPAPGATVAATGIAFAWHGRGADTYRVVLMTETGEPVWSVDTSDTTATLPATVRLTPRAAYFWRVEALADGVTATSAMQRLTVAP